MEARLLQQCPQAGHVPRHDVQGGTGVGRGAHAHGVVDRTCMQSHAGVCPALSIATRRCVPRRESQKFCMLMRVLTCGRSPSEIQRHVFLSAHSQGFGHEKTWVRGVIARGRHVPGGHSSFLERLALGLGTASGAPSSAVSLSALAAAATAFFPPLA